MKKALVFLVLLSSVSYPINHQNHENKQEIQLKIQKEKDDQELRLKIASIVGTVALALITAAVKVYLEKK